MLFGDNKKNLFSKGYHWAGPVLLNPGTAQWVAPVRTVMAQVWALGGGGGGGGTKKGSQNGKASAGGGGAGGLSITNPFLIHGGQIITVSIGQGGVTNSQDGGNTTVQFAPSGINLIARGGQGGATDTGGSGPGGSASGGAINVTGGRGGNGNSQNGRGGGGAAPNGADGGNQGPNSGYMGRCMTDIGGFFVVLNAVGIGTPLCGHDSVRASRGSNGDRGCGGSGASRTRNTGNGGGDGGNGLIVIRWLVKN